MGGCISKQKRSIKGRSKEERRRPIRRELDEKERVTLALKMAKTEWRKDRKRLREEVKRLRQKMEEKEEAKAKQKEWECVVEQMCLMEEALERWKHLYFSIKNELDDLINTTYGETLPQNRQEEGAKIVQELRKEVKVRGETIERLKKRIVLIEKQRNEKEREIDLLRQSLRIIGSGNGKNKAQSSGKNKAQSSATRNLSIFKTKFIKCK